MLVSLLIAHVEEDMTVESRVEVRQDGELIEWWRVDNIQQATAVVNGNSNLPGLFHWIVRETDGARLRTQVFSWIDSRWNFRWEL